jgi:SHS2 domain-containing protein
VGTHAGARNRSMARTAGKAARATDTGHRLVSRATDCVLEAWASDRVGCVSQALAGLVEAFAVVPDAAAVNVLPLTATPRGAEDQLVSLLEDVIDAVAVVGVVPVRFHLVETEDGGIAGDMEVVASDRAHLVGPLPRTVSYEGLSVGPAGGTWRCHVLLER